MALITPLHPIWSSPSEGSRTTANCGLGHPRRLGEHVFQLVARRGPLLARVEDADDVVWTGLDGRVLEKMDHHRQARLHVRRSQSVEPVPLDQGRALALGRDGVEVAGQQQQAAGRCAARR